MALDVRNPGVPAALSAAALFGLATPVAKLLLVDTSPWLLAGLLYTASGLALLAWRLVRGGEPVRLGHKDLLPLAGAVFFGGMLGPLLLMVGLTSMPATGASLLLNAEGLFTALVAWFVFRENADARVVAGFVAIALGALVLA